MVLVDPPPPGPARFEAIPPLLWIASEAIRLGQQIVGSGVNYERIFHILSDCECADVLHDVNYNGVTDMNERLMASNCAPGACWELAVVVTQELTTLGQSSFDKTSIRVNKRRMQTYVKHLKLWEAQAPIPAPLRALGDPSPHVLLLLSSRRREFFDAAHGERHANAFGMYCDAACTFDTLPTLYGEHTEVVQRVCTAQADDIVQCISRAIQR